jgi:hypothetical protein
LFWGRRAGIILKQHVRGYLIFPPPCPPLPAGRGGAEKTEYYYQPKLFLQFVPVPELFPGRFAFFNKTSGAFL